MHVDLFAPLQGTGLAGLAARAEDAGFDGFWTAEVNHDPFLPLAIAADRGVSLTLGTAISVAFARSPMTLAHTTWDLAAATGGRFVLGLGTQIRAHVVGRFAMPWSAPVDRMRDFVGALRAIWSAWQNGERLRYRTDNYRLSLMTPFFDPGPIDHPDVPIYLAAVGPGMARLVGEVADGIHVHPFHTRRYLEEVVAPAIAAGAEGAGRKPESVTLAAPLFVVTGRDDADVARAAAVARSQIAFYASTPAYAPVLETHGWDVGERLNAMSKKGEWKAMAELIDDEMLRDVAVVAAPDRVAAAIVDRCRGMIGRVGLYPAGPLDALDPQWLEIVAAVRSGED